MAACDIISSHCQGVTSFIRVVGGESVGWCGKCGFSAPLRDWAKHVFVRSQRKPDAGGDAAVVDSEKGIR